MGRIKDLDIENRFSWQSVLELLTELCGQAADISFDSRLWKGNRVPTLEIRLDDPVSMKEPAVSEQDGVRYEQWAGNVVAFCGEKPAKLADGSVWLMREDGNAALIYRAFREAVRVLLAVGIPAEFSWSSLPLVPVSDNLQLTLRQEREAFDERSLHTIWLRCDSDETLKQSMAPLSSCGVVSIQNMRTANTWIKNTKS